MPPAGIGAILGGLGGLAGGVGALTRGGQSTSVDLAPESVQQGALQDTLFGADPHAAERTRLQAIIDKGSDGITNAQQYVQAQQQLAALGPVTRGSGGLLDQLTQMTNAGPGQQDVTKALGSQRGLSDLLSEMAKTGGLPSAGDISTSNTLAGGLFNARRTALDQNFTDLDQQNARLAAKLGRDGLDPILAAKLGTTKARLSDSLQSEQSDFANNFALNLPNQRLGYARDAAQVDAGLAQQAANNRASLLGLGSQLLGAERNYQLGASGKTTSNNPGLGDVIGGLFGGVGAGLNLASTANRAFGGTPAPAPGGTLSSQISSYNPLPAYGNVGNNALSSQIANYKIGF